MTCPRRARGRCATVVAVALILVVAGASSCSHGASSEGSNPVPGADSPDGVCRLLSVPLKYAGPEGLSFAALVEAGPEDDEAVGAMLAFGLSADPSLAGDFEPVLGYLARRSVVAETPKGKPRPSMPLLTEVIRANARALDEDLADGRCD